MEEDATSPVQDRRQGRRNLPYSLNFVHRFFDREAGYDRSSRLTHTRSPALNLQYELPMLKSFTPNFTIQNVDKPHGFLRKFTPDGQYLLSFSHDQRSLDMYEFRGVGALASLLQTQEKEFVTAADSSRMSLLIRQVAFERLFKLRYTLRIKYGIPGGYLNREFSVFIENGRYVLIASMGSSSELPPVEHIFEYPDLFPESELFFYNFYLIDLMGEYISDCYSYKFDSIQLSHNHGVSVCKRKIAIHSRYRQCIDLLVIDDGGLVRTHIIGPTGTFLREPNEIISVNDMVINTMPLTHLKQRILTFLYRKCINIKDTSLRKQKLKEFYRDFPKYERMIISKMQLLKKKNLLIRYEQHPNYSDRDSEFRCEPDIYPFKLYVFYCIKTETVVNIYFQNSRELLYALRDYCDYFRDVRSLQTGFYPSSSSNNVNLFNSFNDTVAMLTDPPQRLNPTLPISSQSFSTSPYLDYNLFMYDARQISALERPRVSAMDSFCFRDRETEQPLFRFNLESPYGDGMMCYSHTEERGLSMLTRRELVAFIFHPYEPFVISVQKLLQRYVVNFHIYNKTTIVKQ